MTKTFKEEPQHTVEPWEKEFDKLELGDNVRWTDPWIEDTKTLKAFIRSTLKEAQKEVIEETVEKIELIASQINSEREGAKQAKQALHEAISLLTQKKNTL